VDNISISGNNFSVSHDCGSLIPANGSCIVSVSGSSQGSETLNITLGGTPRIIPVSLGAIASTRPVESTTPSTTIPPTTVPTQSEIVPDVPVIEEVQENSFVDAPKNKIVRNEKLENKKDSLPNTGSESSGILIFSLILILLGSIFVAGKKISKPLL
jgi:LPXTG-motif cell wall-anchored protein